MMDEQQQLTFRNFQLNIEKLILTSCQNIIPDSDLGMYIGISPKNVLFLSIACMLGTHSTTVFTFDW